MYGSAEQVVGELLAQAAARERAFLATKVWTSGERAGIEQMERSMALLRTDHIDLMQVHNLQDWRTHLATLRDWKAKGRISYIGMTHYTDSAHAELERVMRAEPIDFVQFNYSIADRAAEKRLLPLAAERGIAVLINLPFGGGKVLKAMRQQPLPVWAQEIGLRQLEPVAAEVRAVAAGRDLRDPRHFAVPTTCATTRPPAPVRCPVPTSGARACPSWAFERGIAGKLHAAARARTLGPVA